MSSYVRQLAGGTLHAALAIVVGSGDWGGLTRALLVAVRRGSARLVQLDLSGVSALSTEHLNALVNLATAANLLGVDATLVGVSGELAAQLTTSPPQVQCLLRPRAALTA